MENHDVHDLEPDTESPFISDDMSLFDFVAEFVDTSNNATRRPETGSHEMSSSTGAMRSIFEQQRRMSQASVNASLRLAHSINGSQFWDQNDSRLDESDRMYQHYVHNEAMFHQATPATEAATDASNFQEDQTRGHQHQQIGHQDFLQTVDEARMLAQLCPQAPHASMTITANALRSRHFQQPGSDEQSILLTSQVQGGSIPRGPSSRVPESNSQIFGFFSGRMQAIPGTDSASSAANASQGNSFRDHRRLFPNQSWPPSLGAWTQPLISSQAEIMHAIPQASSSTRIEAPDASPPHSSDISRDALTQATASVRPIFESLEASIPDDITEPFVKHAITASETCEEETKPNAKKCCDEDISATEFSTDRTTSEESDTFLQDLGFDAEATSRSVSSGLP